MWLNGLLDSLQRPSVAPALDLRQLELAALAAPVVPQPLRAVLVGGDPLGALREELAGLDEQSGASASPTQRLQWALLERSQGDGERARSLLRDLRVDPGLSASRIPLVEVLLQGEAPPAVVEEPSSLATAGSPADRIATLLEPWSPSPLLRRLGCEQLGGGADLCLEPARSRGALWRLVGINLLPALLLLIGIGLLVRQLWLLARGRLSPAPPLQGPTLSGVDVTLLIAGGFVLLGRVLTPVLLEPLLAAALAGMAPQAPLAQGLQVLGLYLGLMVAPLVLLVVQLAGLGPAPEGGWLQWHWRPFPLTLRWAGSGLLMVLPVVALAGWILHGSGATPAAAIPCSSWCSPAVIPPPCCASASRRWCWRPCSRRPSSAGCFCRCWPGGWGAARPCWAVPPSLPWPISAWGNWCPCSCSGWASAGCACGRGGWGRPP